MLFIALTTQPIHYQEFGPNWSQWIV